MSKDKAVSRIGTYPCKNQLLALTVDLLLNGQLASWRNSDVLAFVSIAEKFTQKQRSYFSLGNEKEACAPGLKS